MLYKGLLGSYPVSNALTAMNAIPSKIGKYEIANEAGRGSMGTVYAANDPFSHRTVAIKVAHAQLVDQSTDDGERFRKLFPMKHMRPVRSITRTSSRYLTQT